MNPFAILHQYYDPASEAYRLLATHSVLVTKKALSIAVDFQARNPQTDVDLAFIYEAAMLHDIGIFRCDAPEILCTGSEPFREKKLHKIHQKLGKFGRTRWRVSRSGAVCCCRCAQILWVCSDFKSSQGI
jgi:hypothetical protein